MLEMNEPSKKQKTPRKKKVENTDTSTITTMGIYKDKKGWRFIELVTQGDQVLSRYETDYPTRRNIAFDEFKIKAAKIYLKDV